MIKPQNLLSASALISDLQKRVRTLKKENSCLKEKVEEELKSAL